MKLDISQTIHLHDVGGSNSQTLSTMNDFTYYHFMSYLFAVLFLLNFHINDGKISKTMFLIF